MLATHLLTGICLFGASLASHCLVTYSWHAHLPPAPCPYRLFSWHSTDLPPEPTARSRCYQPEDNADQSTLDGLRVGMEQIHPTAGLVHESAQGTADA
jgi:hypothetical protein